MFLILILFWMVLVKVQMEHKTFIVKTSSKGKQYKHWYCPAFNYSLFLPPRKGEIRVEKKILGGWCVVSCLNQRGWNRSGMYKFVDSPYYSQSEICGGAMTVSFSKYFPWQAMHFLHRSTHSSKTCCRPFTVSFRRTVEEAVLTSELHFHCLKSLEIAWGEIWTVWRMF
jgi:hypothetical protein